MSSSTTHVWLPSSARAVLLDGFVPVPRGTQAAAPQALSWPVKDPGDVLDYIVGIAPALAGDTGDGIASVSVQITPSNAGDLVLNTIAISGTQAVLWLAGGFFGTNYAVTLNISTTNGRTLARTILLPVLALATVIAPPGALLASNGMPLTDQNGSPIIASPGTLA